ncbi:MAG: Zn-ribbon domain-containing OB-fold protein [Candidatus Bathyarchaeota archaeon]|nr:MAG: Zn-ribbon domain-containing OB-fold protein [Candidatus Bathyarchaeota archaeon]
MNFAKFGKISYVAETKLQEFEKHLETGKVMGTRCKSCGQTYFPPRADCNCLKGDIEWIELSGKCKLMTFSTLYFAPASFRYEVPYTLGVAQFEEGPAVLAPFSKEIKENEIKVGMSLRLVPTELIGGRMIYELRKADS